MTVSINSLAGHIIATTIVSLLTLASFFVLYQLLSGFYCHKSRETSTFPPPIGKQRVESAVSSQNSSGNDQTSDPSPISQTVTRESNHEPIQVFFKRNTIAVCIIWTIICIACALDRITLLANPDRERDPFQYIIYPFYFIGLMMLSLIFIGRLHYTFHGTLFGYSKCTMNTLKGMWLIMALTSLLAVGLSSASSTRMIGIAFCVVVIFLNIVLSFVLLFLYCKKLYVLISANDARLLAVMTKYSLLYTVCFASTFGFLVIVTIQAVSGANSNATFRSEDAIILVGADALVNSVCLWLNLTFADPWYHVLCKWGDKQCTKCCKICANDTVESQVTMEKYVVPETEENVKHVRPDMNVTVQSSQTGNQAIIL
eukprot:624817_1